MRMSGRLASSLQGARESEENHTRLCHSKYAWTFNYLVCEIQLQQHGNSTEPCRGQQRNFQHRLTNDSVVCGEGLVRYEQGSETNGFNHRAANCPVGRPRLQPNELKEAAGELTSKLVYSFLFSEVLYMQWNSSPILTYILLYSHYNLIWAFYQMVVVTRLYKW